MCKNALYSSCIAAVMSTMSYSAYADPDVYIRRRDLMPNEVIAPVIVEEVQPVVVEPIPGLQFNGIMETGGYVNIGQYGADEDFLPSALSVQNPQKPKNFGLISPSLRLSVKKESWFRGSIIEFIAKGGIDKKAARLSAAYMRHKKFDLGLAKSSFCVPVDAGEIGVPCSSVKNSTMQIRWKPQLGDRFKAALGLEQAANLDPYPEIEKEADKLRQPFVVGGNIPAVAASLESELGAEAGVKITVAGLFRAVDLYDTASRDTIFLYTWGANFSTIVELVPAKTALKIYGVYGEGIGSYLVDFGATPKQHRKDVYLSSGVLTPLTTYGGYICLGHNFSSKLESVIAGGALDVKDAEARGEDHYKMGAYGTASLVYKPTEQVAIGGGYIYAGRKVVSSTDMEHAHRLYTELSYSF